MTTVPLRSAVRCRFSLSVFAAGLLPLVISCSGSNAASSSHPSSYPVYTGESTKLFDDRIDPSSVGLADITTKARMDPVLRARTQSAETVARVRVSTVTVDTAGGKPAYHLNLAIVEPLTRRRYGERSVEILVTSDSPSFGIIKWLDTRLMGRTFVAFFRHFAGVEDPVVRFHLSSDDAEVLAAVREADTVGEVSGK
jgi:hypothetical protein